MRRGVTKQQYAVMWRVMRCACARLRELEHGVTRRLPQVPAGTALQPRLLGVVAMKCNYKCKIYIIFAETFGGLTTKFSHLRRVGHQIFAEEEISDFAAERRRKFSPRRRKFRRGAKSLSLCYAPICSPRLFIYLCAYTLGWCYVPAMCLHSRCYVPSLSVLYAPMLSVLYT